MHPGGLASRIKDRLRIVRTEMERKRNGDGKEMQDGGAARRPRGAAAFARHLSRGAQPGRIQERLNPSQMRRKAASESVITESESAIAESESAMMVRRGDAGRRGKARRRIGRAARALASGPGHLTRSRAQDSILRVLRRLICLSRPATRKSVSDTLGI